MSKNMLSRLRLEYAAEVFLASMRKAHIKRNPSADPSIVRRLAEYPPEQAADLMAAIQASIVSISPEAEVRFNEWAQKRTSQQNPPDNQ